MQKGGDVLVFRFFISKAVAWKGAAIRRGDPEAVVTFVHWRHMMLGMSQEGFVLRD